MVRAFESPDLAEEREWVTGPLHLSPRGDEDALDDDTIVDEKSGDEDLDDEALGDDDLDDDLVDLDDEYDDFDGHEHGSGGAKFDD